MFRQLAIVLLIAAASQATIYEPCGGSATVNSLNIEGCPDGVDGRCTFVRGRSYKTVADVTGNAAASALPYTVKATILGIPITLESGNACDSLTSGSCPATPGGRFVFETVSDITDTYPAIQSTLTIEVRDQANTLLVCAKAKFEIVNA